jgi:SAM-dependent methyltransferase
MFASPRFVERLDDCFFYHTMELPELGVIQRVWDLRGRFDDYTGKADVAGKSVLDIGCATGFLSFAAEKCGAARVVSFDMSDVRQQAFVPFAENSPQREPNEWWKNYAAGMERWKNAYWLSHRLLHSNAQVFYGDVYDLPGSLGQFDVVIIGSVLEHLRDPVGALQSITRLAGETLVIVTPILQSDETIARFEPRLSAPQNDFTWWTYSTGLYREFLAILGFRIERITTAEYFHVHAERLEPRTTIVASRTALC